MMKEFSSEDILTYKEWNVIEKYRSLDDFGKKHIDDELDHEVKRVQQIHKLQDSSPSPSLDSAAGPEPQASSDAAAAEAAYEKRLGIVPAAGSSASSTTGAAGGKIG